MPADEEVNRAVDILRSGGLIGLPTETVYGLGADASNVDAVRRVFAVKGRPADHPLIVHVATAAALDAWAIDVPDAARRLADRFWPGPLTLVLWRHPDVLDEVTGGRDTVALRVPGHPVALAVLRAFGGGVAAPSANRFGRVSPTTAEHVRDDLGADVDLVLDGGPCVVGVESTIVDLTTDVPVLLRPGAVTVEDLAAVLGRPVETAATGPARAPGMLTSHYAPRCRVVLVPGEPELTAESAALTAAGATVRVLAHPAAHDLYREFRRADADDVDVLLVVPPAEDGIGRAVADRVRKAAAAHL